MNLTQRPIYQKGQKPMKSPKLRASANAEACTLRLPCCNGDAATVVLAHLRFFGWAGMAQKPHDLLSVYACAACHDALDGRRDRGLWGYDDLLRAYGETITRMHDKGLLRLAPPAQEG